jgi:predicted transcriptional regulator of viral defense system
MNSFNKLYDAAIENYGIITSGMAKEHGVSAMALVQLARRGRLVHIRRGLYRLSQYVPTEYDEYAEAVAVVGRDSYLYGETVLALLKLTETDPTRLYVASAIRQRKSLPRFIVVRPAPADYVPIDIQGIPCQRVEDALESAAETVDGRRLSDAAREAYRLGYIGKDTANSIARKAGKGQ